MGNMKRIMNEKHNRSRLASNAKGATVNLAGGVAFDIDSPALKLVTMTGGSFFAEPRYYDANKIGKHDPCIEQRVKIQDDVLEGVAECSELDFVAREILVTAIDIIESDTPEDLLVIANWLRNEMNIRLTPQVLLVIASRFSGTQCFVRKYANVIVRRPDEVKTCLLLHRFFFGSKTVKNCLAKGLSDALSKFSERSLLKYNGDTFPKWKDVLCWLPRRKGRPLSSQLAMYFISGQIVDPEATPVIFARSELAKQTEFDDKAKQLALDSFVNWEVLLSQFGTNMKSKEEVWEFLLGNKLIGYMALLRNVRNLLKVGLSKEAIKNVAKELSDRENVLRSKQLPFRFLSAWKVVKELRDVDHVKMGIILEAIEEASTIAAENIPELPGITAVFADNSGSMDISVSENSTVTCADAANVLCGIVANRSEEAYVAAFATAVAPVVTTKNNTVLSIADKISKANTQGWSTNAHLCVRWLEKNNIVPDRVIIISDMQCWDDSFSGNLADEWQSYKRRVGEPWIHCVHLNGSGDNPIQAESDKVNLVSGFNEKILTMLLKTEGTLKEDSVTTVEQIRKEWTLK